MRIFPALLIAFGSFLEVYYYAYRFTQDGIEVWLAVVIGIALTLLLSMSVFMRKIRWMWAVIIPLYAYSVLSTSAGQTFSMIQDEKQQEVTRVQEEYTLDELKQIEARIGQIDVELKGLNERISATVKNLEDQFTWKNTYAAATERKEILENERKELAGKLAALRTSATVRSDEKRVQTENLYTFYENLFGIAQDSLRFGFHTILSIFIALMAPIGIMTISLAPKATIEVGRRRQTSRERKIRLSKAVEEWVAVNWVGKRLGKTETVLPKDTFLDYVKKKNGKFSKRKYDKIFTASEKRSVTQNGTIKVPDEKKAITLIQGELNL